MKDPKLSYIPNQFRVRCEFTKEFCDSHPQPPEDLIERAIKKLALEMALGHVAEYNFFEKKLNQVWQAFRSSDEAKDEVIAITLASGAPNFEGITIEKNEDLKTLVNISINQNPEIFEQTVSRDLFKYHVGKTIRSFYNDSIYDLSDIYGIWFSAIRGEKIKSVGVRALDRAMEHSKKFQFVLNKQFNLLSLHVYDVKRAEDEEFFHRLIKHCHKECLKVYGPRNYIILKNDLVRRFRSANRGIERLGFDLPLIIPAAIPAKSSRKPKLSFNKSDKEEEFDRPEYFVRKFDELIKIDVSMDKMKVVIEELDEKVYFDFPSFKFQWLSKELYRRNFVIADEVLSKLKLAIEKKKEIRYFTLCEGKPPVDATGPYLFLSYQERIVPEDDEIVDFRNLKRTDMVTKGDLIAEIKYENPSIDGVDVFGNIVPAKKVGDLDIQYPEEVERRGHRFYALCDGVPQISGKTIAFRKLLIHKGDVNLSSGDIRFTGPVIIKGNVEQGASVIVDGDVHIRGSFYGAFLDVKGDLKVDGGINVNSLKSLFIGGNLEVKFIESANIQVKGDSTVKQSILGGQFVAGGNLIVRDRIVSSRVFATNEIHAQHVGRREGVQTDIYLGVSFKDSQSFVLNLNRFDYFNQLGQELKHEINILKAKNEGSAVKSMEKRLAKLSRIIKKLSHTLKKKRKKMTENRNSRLYVSGVLGENTEIHFGDAVLPVKNEVAAVEVRFSENGRGFSDFVLPLKKSS